MVIYFLYIMLFSILISQTPNNKLYVTMQMTDQVAIINTETNQIESIISIEMQENNNLNCMDYMMEMECNMASGCEWMMGMCMESSDQDCMDYTMEMECDMASECEWMMGMCMENMNMNDINTPHYIVMDETLGYWFVTTIASGYIAQYSLVDNQYIDSYFVGDAPAILTIDVENQKLYCSRMMPMSGMGNMMPESESRVIQALKYSAMGLEMAQIPEYEIDSPAPHGIVINDDGTEIFTASNTTDWLYKIDVQTEIINGVSMGSGNPADQVIQRLKPIQCLSINDKLFITCSAGSWYNPFTGENSIIPGQLQMWNSNTMQLLDVLEFGDFTGPWHIKESTVDNIIYIALSGDNLYDTEGLAAVRYENNSLNLEWITNDSSFDTLHGVDTSYDSQNIYVSGRGDGNIYIFSNDGQHINTISLGSMTMLGGIASTKGYIPEFGDSNNSMIIDVVDIVNVVNHILNGMMFSPYELYASDCNQDQIIDISDIIMIVNIILSF